MNTAPSASAAERRQWELGARGLFFEVSAPGDLRHGESKVRHSSCSSLKRDCHWLFVLSMGCTSVEVKSFLELCCDPDSGLCTAAAARRRHFLRVTKGCKFHTARGLGLALAFLAEHPDADTWTSLPCTAWCTWSFVNEARLGDRHRARLAWQRRQSMRMAKHAETCLATAIAGGGSGHFEWPRPRRGWQKRRIRGMIARLQLVLADFGGCSFGVMASPSLLALKP